MIPSEEEWINALEARHGKELQKKFSETTVAICGLGGLGSNIATALARVGIGKLILIDFDCVDITNLHRQQYKVNQIGIPKPEALAENLKEIAPYVMTEPHSVKLTQTNATQLLKNADIVCEAFDNPENKAMLVNLILEKFPDKFLVAASGMAGIGSANAVKTKIITNKFYLCGDGVSDVQTEQTLFAPRVMLCAAHQALTVVRILADKSDI